MTAINVGDQAPDFERPDQHGQPLRLSDYRGQRAVVVYFYPKDETPGCTRQACAFRDHYQNFVDAGAEVIGISSDGDDSHRSFSTHHQLPFRLIADADASLRTAFGVPKTLGLLPGRVTYVIDRDGIVQHVFNSQLAPRRHIEEALASLAAT